MKLPDVTDVAKVPSVEAVVVVDTGQLKGQAGREVHGWMDGRAVTLI